MKEISALRQNLKLVMRTETYVQLNKQKVKK